MGIYGNTIKQPEQGKRYQLYRRYAGKAVTFIEENGELKFSIEGRVLSKSFKV